MRRLDQVNGRQDNVVVGGIVTEIKPIVDRNGKTMAFVTLEDFSGSGEVLVFSEPYSMHRELVTIDSLILVHGHLSKKEEDNKVIASEIIPLTEAREKLVRSVVVTLNSDQVTDENINSLKDVFGTYPGDCDVMIEVSAHDQGLVNVKAGTSFRVRPADELLKTIRSNLGTKGGSYSRRTTAEQRQRLETRRNEWPGTKRRWALEREWEVERGGWRDLLYFKRSINAWRSH